MPEQIYGVENLKKFVKFACGFTEQVAEVLEDGKVQLLELPKFLDEVLEIPGLVKSWEAVKKELSELSPEERQEVYDYLKDEFDIPNDRVELAIEHSISWVMNTLALYEMFKAMKKTNP